MDNDDSEVPLPPPLTKLQPGPDGKRLWIGNLDLKLREYQLLKIVEKFGTLVEFDFLYHRSGPQAGQPRGYAFVTYEKFSSANSAVRALDGMGILGRKMAVKWAHAQDETKYEQVRVRPAPSVLSAGSTGNLQNPDRKKSKPTTKETKIAALEAKLKLLENNETSSMNLQPDVGTSSNKPTTVTYNFIERKPRGDQFSHNISRKYRSSAPYHRSNHHKK